MMPMLGASAPRGRARDQTVDLRQGVARVTVGRYGKMHHELQVWLLESGLTPMGVLAVGDLGAVSEVLTAYLQHVFNDNRPYSHAPYTMAAVPYFHRRLWGQLRGTWAAVKTWETAEPGELRAPEPVMVLWGLMAVATAEPSTASCGQERPAV